MTTWRKWAVPMLAVTLFAAGCSGDDSPPNEPADAAPPSEPASEPATEEPETPSETPTEEPVTRADADLVIWADEDRLPVIQPFADAFAEDNGITVAIQELEFGQIRDRLAVAGPAGEGPDIFIGAHDWLGQLVSAGVVEPLDLGARAGDFVEAAIQAFNYDGQTYGLPYALENIALVRNVGLVPEAPATFEDLERIALELRDAGTVEVPLAMQWADPYHQYPLFSAFGASVFGRNADGTYDPAQLGIDTAEGLAAAQAYAGWLESGLLDPNITYDVMIESFGSGEAPFAITGPWAISQGETGFKATGVDYVVEPIPPVAGGEPQPFVGVQGFMVSSFAPNKLLATTFVLDLMSTQEAQVELFKVGGRAPALTAAFDEASSDPDVAGFGAAGRNGHPMPAIPEMGSVWEAWTNAYTLIGQGSDPEQSFRDAAEQIRTLIDG